VFALTSFGLLETARPGGAIDLSYYFACPPLKVLILTVVVMSILTPLTDEIINRGLISGTMSHRDPRIAIAISAVPFSVLHQPSGMPNAFVFGVFVAIQLLRYRTLWLQLLRTAHITN
jgi:membrane protease YdiL (CAAX protease family)